MIYWNFARGGGCLNKFCRESQRKFRRPFAAIFPRRCPCWQGRGEWPGSAPRRSGGRRAPCPTPPSPGRMSPGRSWRGQIGPRGAAGRPGCTASCPARSLLNTGRTRCTWYRVIFCEILLNYFLSKWKTVQVRKFITVPLFLMRNLFVGPMTCGIFARFREELWCPHCILHIFCCYCKNLHVHF